MEETMIPMFKKEKPPIPCGELTALREEFEALKKDISKFVRDTDSAVAVFTRNLETKFIEYTEECEKLIKEQKEFTAESLQTYAIDVETIKNNYREMANELYDSFNTSLTRHMEYVNSKLNS